MTVSDDLPSAAFFNPQAKAATEEYLNGLRAYLCMHGQLQPFVEAIRMLPQTWDIYVRHRTDLARLPQGPKYTKALADWINGGDSIVIANAMSGCCALPVLTIVQTCQYFQFLELKDIKHHQLLEALSIGGVHGYCGGLLPAVAVALSADERELAQNASKALRIAVGIGAYGDLGDEDVNGGSSNMVIRLKYPGQGDELVSLHPGAYISAVTDPRTISVVGPASVLEQIHAFAGAHGLRSQGVHIRGKVHNPENTALAADLEVLCLGHDSLRLPGTSELKVPFRSNLHGGTIGQCLTREVLQTIMTSRCEWYQLLQHVAADIKRPGRISHNLINFGTGDCLSLIPFRQLGLTISKSNVAELMKNASPVNMINLRESYKYPSTAVAVIGMACRFPSANNVEELWDLISFGKTTVQKLHEDRVDTRQSFRVTQDRKWASRQNFYGNFLDRHDSFDHTFFGMNPREAVYMDPQQRLLLETSYQAVEASGYLHTHKKDHGDNVGVFIGSSNVDYLTNTSSHPPSAYTSTGTLRSFLCGRISHHFGWTGPAEVVDTACSSSLVAINRACKAIQHGECSMALAGGVNAISSIDDYLDLGKAGFLSATGQCKPFSNDADGYCRAEGVGLVFLKSLDQALRDNDQILGVVCGSASNQGGLSSSITVPHSPTQIALYRKLLDQAGMKSNDVSYVEAHGTGTQVGDPLEIASIREVFGGRDRDTTMHVGSIKGNIGHCETAAGVAGFIKAILLLQKGAIPPLASHTNLNLKIPDLSVDHMAIASSKQDWSVPLRAACINSYGAAGSNAAVLLCQPPSKAPSRLPLSRPVHGSRYPFLLSAHSEGSLAAYVKDLSGWLKGSGAQSSTAADIAYTLAKKRQHHRFRWSTTSRNLDDLISELDGGQITGVSIEKPRSVVLVFCGQVGQAIGLNESLYQSCETFRLHLDQCNYSVCALGIPSMIPAIFETEPISDIRLLHCCVFAQQYACAQSWIDSGLKIDAIVGQSFGELTALAIAGILSLEDTLTLIVARASLIQSQWGHESGSMLAVRCTHDTAQQIINDLKQLGKDVEIACHNAEDSFVLGGARDAITATELLLKHEQKYNSVRAQKLDVTHAYHTKLTEGIIPDLEGAAGMLNYKSPTIPIATCTRDKDHVISSEYIRSHLRNPVYFQSAVRRLENRLGNCIWLEAGSDSSAFSVLKRATALPEGHVFQSVRFLGSTTPLNTIASISSDLWREGIDVSFWGFQGSHQGLQQVWLPPYHFHETRHWLPYVDHAMEALNRRTTPSDEAAQSPQIDDHMLVTRLTPQSHDDVKRFDVRTNTRRFIDIVTGHSVLRRPLCPAGMYLECATMAAQQLLDDQKTCAGLALDNCTFEHPLGVDPDRAVTMTFQKHPSETAWFFEISSRSRSQEVAKSSVHAKGMVDYEHDVHLQHYQRLISRRVQEIQICVSSESLWKEKAYMVFNRVVDYSNIFKGISVMKFADTEALACVDVPSQASTSETTALKSGDTISLDVFIQVSGLLINSHSICPTDSAYLAVGVDSIRIAKSCDLGECKEWTVYAVFVPIDHNKAKADVFIMHRTGELVIAMIGIEFSKVPLKTLEKLLDASTKVSKRNIDSVQISTCTSETAVAPTKLKGSKEQAEMIPKPCKDEFRPQLRDQHSEGKRQGVESLRALIASYVGLPSQQATDQTSLGTLGIDSLASIEVADELSSRYGTPIAATTLLGIDFSTLCHQLGMNEGVHPAETAPATLAASQTLPGALRLSRPRMEQVQAERQKLVEIISQYSGCPVSSITDDATIEEMGIDSLAMIELKAEVEAKFHIELDDNDLEPGSTVNNVLQLLNSNSDGSAEFSNEGATSSSTSLSSMVLTPKPPEMHKTLGKPELSVLQVNPVQILAACDALFPLSAKDNGFAGHWDIVAPKYDKVVISYLVEAFAYLGSDLRSIQPDGPVRAVDFLPKHSQVMQCFWDNLERHGIIYRKQDTILRTSKRITDVGSSQLTRGYAGCHPRYTVDFTLMALTGPVLADCLTGTTDPLKILFGDSKAQQVLNDFYHESPMLATMTDQLLVFMKQIIGQTNPKDAVRIIEIGAGFGGTTTALAKMLQGCDHEVEYTFTDIAPTLVDKARQHFSEYSWMDFGTLNLDRDPPSKYHGRYDIVIATNVVHATKDLVVSTLRLKSLLREGGFICLSEITKVIDWHNIVFGLLPGWWSFIDGRKYALQSAEEWMKVFEKAGFVTRGYSTGPNEEAKTQQLLIGSTRAEPKEQTWDRTSQGDSMISTVVYKTVDDTEIHADIYFPKERVTEPMPIALMIHGGGYMTLSRKAVRPLQTRFLLKNGILPVSLDHRLCPEVNIIDGPMADVRDATVWARSELPAIALEHGIRVESSKIVIIGWSTGGHLAMTTAWTTVDAGIEPPTAILNFYGPSDFDALGAQHNQGGKDTASTVSTADIRQSMCSKPITTYHAKGPKDETSALGWLVPSDPRSDLVLSLFRNNLSSNLSLLLNPVGSEPKPPTQSQLDSINPLTQVQRNNYHTPTFIIHGTKDEIILYTQSIAFDQAMMENGVASGVLIVEGAKHIHDLGVGEESEMWEKGVGPGYEFLLKHLHK
ncbi:MAG: hypothetical protein Q9213_007622 [Squamulea squamosa]